jgi:pimeloyl-ACP methyl ester carboxylesterase
MRPILLLHGALGSKSQLDPLQKALEACGYRVYAMNFSGHSGQAFENGFGIETFSQDVLHFLNEKELEQVDIFGYSMGGYVALWFAHVYPHRVGKIIALGTKFDWSPESAEKEIRKVDPDKIEEKIPAFARILEHRHLPNDWKELLYKTGDMMLKLGNRPLLTFEILQTIKHDVLILLGDLDDMADLMHSKKVAEALPHGKFSALEKTPHPIERVDVKFLQRVIIEKLSSSQES